MNILVVNGPNLNLLGRREKHYYGSDTLEQLHQSLSTLSKELNHSIDFFQSNSEGELIDRIHACLEDKTDFIIINPAAFTHTSIALRDALLAVAIPFIEVHLSNIYQREAFRHHSYFSDIAVGVITGLGTEGYALAVRYIDSYTLSPG